MNDDRELARFMRVLTTRRVLLRGAALGGAGLAAAALIGCGDDEDEQPAATPAATAAAAAPTATATEAAAAAATATEAAAAAATARPTEAAPAGPDYVAQALADGAPFPYGYDEPEGTPKSGGILRISLLYRGTPATFDTGKQLELAASTATFSADRLVGFATGQDLGKYLPKIQPELAKSWEVRPDGLEFTFELEPNVNYQNVAPVNGRRFTAQDVKLTYDRHAAGGLNQAFFAYVDSFTVVDEQTFSIQMSSPDADLPVALASRQLPIYAPELWDDGLIETTAIGTGAAILTDVEKEAQLTFESNPDYWQGKPYLDGAELVIIPDVAARLAEYRVGRLDHANSIIRNKEQADALIESNPGTRITSDPITNAISFFAFNTDHPTLQDDRVRQAMSLALDREEMVQILSGGLGRVLPVFLWPLVFDKEPSEDELGRWWRHDPAEAKKLVAAAGAEGVKLTTLFTPSYGASQPNNIAFVTSPWKDIGINLESQDVDFQTFSALRFTSKFRDDPESQMMQGYSTAAPTAKGSFFDLVHTQSSQNVHKVNDPDIDAWAEQAVGEFDPDARRELHRKIWDRELDRVLRLSMSQTFNYTPVQPWLRYYRWNGAFISVYHTFDWGFGYHKAWLDK